MRTREVYVPELADLPVGNVAGLTSLDVATGQCMGFEPRDPLPEVREGIGIVDAFKDVLDAPLSRGRCMFSFSGGSGSTWALAMAVTAARERGYPDPVPVTIRYRDTPELAAEQWQEAVIGHFGLREWEKIDIGDELEVVGRYAQRSLARDGILFPSNAYTLLPQLERAKGADLILPVGGSDFWMFWRWAPLAELLAGQRRPRRSDAAILGFAAVPRPLRVRVARRKMEQYTPAWLRPAAARELLRIRGEQMGTIPISFAAAIREQQSHRCYMGTRRSLAAMAESEGARLTAPMLEPAFLAASAKVGGWRGLGGREALNRATAEGIIPPQLLARRPGSDLHDVLIGRQVREFARSWSGEGLDEAIVDPEAARRTWLGDRVSWQSCALLQLAWQHDAGLGRAADGGRTNFEFVGR